MKKALITGALGQDGSYLSEYLLSLGYEVHGVVRGLPTGRVDYFVPGVTYHIGDLRDAVVLENIFRKVWPDELYNLAAQVFVPTSWIRPEDTFDINVGGLARLLTIVDTLKRDTRVYQASSSEMFGNVSTSMWTTVNGQGRAMLDEDTPMYPVSPYGVSKHAAHELALVYRQKGIYVVSGILFNHESPRRGMHMVTRKISMQVASWVAAREKGQSISALRLGNISSARDWGHAQDYVKGMWTMMQQDEAQDFVLGTGVAHTIIEFVKAAVKAAGLDWDEYREHVVHGKGEFSRPNELYCLCANPIKARTVLGWTPKVSFEELVKCMVDADCKLALGNHAETVAR